MEVDRTVIILPNVPQLGGEVSTGSGKTVTMTGKLGVDVGSGLDCGCWPVANGQSGLVTELELEVVVVEGDTGTDVDSVAMLGSGCGSGAVDIAVVGGKVMMPTAGDGKESAEDIVLEGVVDVCGLSTTPVLLRVS